MNINQTVILTILLFYNYTSFTLDSEINIIFLRIFVVKLYVLFTRNVTLN